MQRLLILVFLLPALLFSQYNGSGYIESMTESLNLKFDIDNNREFYEFENKSNTIPKSYTIAPNTGFRTTLNFNYRFISFRVGYSPQFLIPGNIEEKGQTKVFKIQTDMFFGNRWMQTFQYSKVRGFYASDFKDADGNPVDIPGNPSGILKFPEMNTVSVFGRTTYKFNDRFSLKALYTQTEIQRKRAGSVISSLTYSYTDIRNPENKQDVNTLNFILNTGYFYNLVLGQKWYVFAGLSPGLGMEFYTINTTIDDTTNVNHNNEFVANLFTQVGIGYNSKNIHIGLDFRNYVTERSEKSPIQFSTVQNILRFYIGYRFKAPRFLKKSVDWVEDVNPLN